MAHDFKTPTILAREALMRLRKNSVMLNLVHRELSKEVVKGRGQTISIRKPAPALVPSAFVRAEGITLKDIDEDLVTVTFGDLLDNSVAITAEQWSWNIEKFGAQVLEPMMVGFAEVIDTQLFQLYKDIPYRYGAAGTTPDGLDDLTGCRKVLTDNLCPLPGRNLVLDTTAEAKFLQLDTLVEADKRGDKGTTLREASLGRAIGFDLFVGQNVQKHTAGAGTVVFGEYGALAGATSIDVTGVTTALVVGDLLTIGGRPYVVKTAGALAGGAQTLGIYPALAAAAEADDEVTVVADHTANLAFHRQAFGLVCAPVALPKGVPEGKASHVSYDGLSLRLVMGYDIDQKQDILSVDMCVKAVTLYPELACRLLG